MSDVSPPPAPASEPQENFPVTEFHMIFPDDESQAVSPAPNKYPEFKSNPLVIESPPAIVDVALVLVALKNPNVGVEVATIFPDASVERIELMAVDIVFCFPLSDVCKSVPLSERVPKYALVEDA